MKKSLLGILALFLVSGSINVVSAESLDNDIYIDSSLSAKDKQSLREVMKGLDKEDRKNVVYLYEDGSFTANRPELIDEIKKQNVNALDPNGKFKLKKIEPTTTESLSVASKKDSKHEVSVLSYANPVTACPAENPPHGPFRRVTSTQGKSRITANIYLPSKSANEVVVDTSKGEKAHIYMGATSSTGTVDMGLALNYDAGAAGSTTTETWGMFVTGDTANDGKFGNFKMGTEVFMKFYVVTSTSVALYVNGVNKAGTPTEITLTAQVASTKNFNTSGSGMSVKRITSIAQTTETTTNSFLNNVHWYNVKAGTTSGTEVLMDSTSTAVACGYKTTNVLVDYVSQSNEYIKLKAGTLTP